MTKYLQRTVLMVEGNDKRGGLNEPIQIERRDKQVRSFAEILENADREVSSMRISGALRIQNRID